MPDERETILEHLRTILWDTPGRALVTRRDHRALIGTLTEYPAICIVDAGDEVIEVDGRRNPVRRLFVSFQIIHSGATEDSAPSELATFVRLFKKQLYQRVYDCSVVKNLRPQTISPLNPIKVGGKVVHQYHDYEITYIEDLRRLFTEVLETL